MKSQSFIPVIGQIAIVDVHFAASTETRGREKGMSIPVVNTVWTFPFIHLQNLLNKT